MPTTHKAVQREYERRPGYLLSLALLQANKDGRWLAGRIGATDAQVSSWRKGTTPRKQRRQQIAAALSDELGRKITPAELGWED